MMQTIKRKQTKLFAREKEKERRKLKQTEKKKQKEEKKKKQEEPKIARELERKQILENINNLIKKMYKIEEIDYLQDNYDDIVKRIKLAKKTKEGNKEKTSSIPKFTTYIETIYDNITEHVLLLHEKIIKTRSYMFADKKKYISHIKPNSFSNSNILQCISNIVDVIIEQIDETNDRMLKFLKI